MSRKARFIVVLLMVAAPWHLIGCSAPKAVYPGRTDADRPVDPPARVSSLNPLDAALADLTGQLTKAFVSQDLRKVAVIEFSDLDGRTSDLGKYLAEELVTRLFRTGKFEVIERQLLNKVLDEHKLSLSDLIDPGSAIELGKLLGVEAIVTGTLTDLVANVRVNGRVISTSTGAVVSVAAANLPMTETVDTLLGSGGRTVAAGGPSRSSAGKGRPGEARVVIDDGEVGQYQWGNGAPYATTTEVASGQTAYIPTGNNYFKKALGVIGYEAGEVRYLCLKVFLKKRAAGMSLQFLVDGKWRHRWGVDGRVSHVPMTRGWKFQGSSTNLPVGEWVEIKIDLLGDLGVRPGQRLQGLAFSGADGSLIYDDVYLAPSDGR